jgi:hypothetical protein
MQSNNRLVALGIQDEEKPKENWAKGGFLTSSGKKGEDWKVNPYKGEYIKAININGDIDYIPTINSYYA